MQETVGRVTSLEQRVRTMDMELKEHFLEMRAFMSQALAGVEARLGGRMDRLERDMKAGFQVVDGRLGRVERRLDQMDLKLDVLIRRLPRPARQTGSKRSRSRKASR